MFHFFPHSLIEDFGEDVKDPLVQNERESMQVNSLLENFDK